MVPDALNTEVVSAVHWVRQSSQRLDEEALSNSTLAFQYQNPRVNSQSVQTVFVRQLQQLATISHEKSRNKATTK